MEQLSKAQLRRQRIDKRNAAIKIYYQQLSQARIGQARKYSEDAMIVMIADKFFLAEKTVEDILCNRTQYKNVTNNSTK